MANDLEGKWSRLVEWIKVEHPGFECRVEWKEVPGAGRGLFAVSDVKPGETLLSIPPTALLNPLTLRHSTIPSHLFPQPATSAHRSKRPLLSDDASRRLNTTQLLTLHLALSRDPEARHPSNWSAYIDTLPESFRPWHPLTWVGPPPADGEQIEGKHVWRWWEDLADVLPRGARDKLDDVKRRYEADLEVLERVLKEEEPFKSQLLSGAISTDDIVWAWLNVNTRTVSVPLNLPLPFDLHNHTLVPILDFVNHSTSSSLIVPKPRQTFKWLMTPGKVGFSLVAPERGLAAGEEIMFEYGSHSNDVLFAEYGFVEKGRAYSGVDVDWIVEELWREAKCGKEKEEVLKAIGCWRQNVIEGQSKAVQPSYGLLMTLRVLYLPKTSDKLAAIKNGHLTFVSPKNEAKVKHSVRTMCDLLVEGCETNLARLAELRMDDEDQRSAVSLIRDLLEGKLRIAQGLQRVPEVAEIISS